MSSAGPSPAAAPAVIAVVGATAAGKTGLSLDLAARLGGEVVNTDAMAVYRGMDIGTAKLPVAERQGIRHHLVDLLDVTEPLSVAQFQGWARETVADIRSRGATPVLVGGSALYTRAVLDRFEFPGTDPVVRRELETELDRLGPPALHARLAEVDPDAAARILPDNGRRVVRALEVIRLTGRPFRASLPAHEYADPRSVQIGLDIDRATLDLRIAERVRRMFDAGFVEEVRRLLDAGLAESRTARTAIGYREVAAYLDDRTTYDETVEATIRATRRFSRRQDSWFRKDPRVVWVRWDAPDRVEQALAAVEAVRLAG
jgi:tRNA dimethylallyltransferase